jgi:hypothetical protein
MILLRQTLQDISIKTLTAFLLFLSLFPSAAFAGEINVFVKTGYFSWNESTATRSNFLSENGVAIEQGVSYTAHVVPFVTLTGSASAKIAAAVYTGTEDNYGNGNVTSGRVNISPKGEVKATGEIPVNGIFTIGPVAGIRLEELFRPFASERWDIVTTNTGLKGSYGPVSIEAGASAPIYTVNHYTSNDFDVSLHPKGMVSPYAEVKYIYSNGKNIHLFYEESRWSASEAKMQNRSVVTSTGVYISREGARQPDSATRFIGFQFDWNL